MYQIHKEVNVHISHVTPLAVKKYQEYLSQETNEEVKGLTETVRENLKQSVKGGEITEKSLVNTVGKLISDRAIESMEVYVDTEFFENWAPVVYKITEEQLETIRESFESGFYWDEFMRGFFDFFSRLRQPSTLARN